MIRMSHYKRFTTGGQFNLWRIIDLDKKSQTISVSSFLQKFVGFSEICERAGPTVEDGSGMPWSKRKDHLNLPSNVSKSNSPIAISLGSYMDKAAGRRACTGKKITQDVSVLSR